MQSKVGPVLICTPALLTLLSIFTGNGFAASVSEKLIDDAAERVKERSESKESSPDAGESSGHALIGKTFWVGSYSTASNSRYVYEVRRALNISPVNIEPVKIKVTDYAPDPTRYGIGSKQYEVEMPSGEKKWIVADLLQKALETGVLLSYDPGAKQKEEEAAEQSRAKALAAKRAAARAKLIQSKNWPESIKQDVLNRKVGIGMTQEQVTLSWGKPERINQSVGPWGTHEQWIYGHTYLYFENGVLRSYQSSR
jgi:hypothetical protein